jgi:hypothetical protein
MAYQHTGSIEPGRRMDAKEVLTQVRKRLNEASDSQARLATARQQLLIKRERVRTSSRRVQLKRVDAGDAEATYMSRLREFVNNYREKLPSTLLDAYDKVERTRDDLGEIEENYLQAERDLTGAEWTFMDQENAFYQFDLHGIMSEEDSEGSTHSSNQLTTVYSHPPPPPPPYFYSPILDNIPTALGVYPPSPCSLPPPFLIHSPKVLCPRTILEQGYSTLVTEIDGLRKDFDDLRQQKAHHIVWEDGPDVLLADGVVTPEADLTASTMEYFDILDKLSDVEAKAQLLRVEKMSQRLQASALIRRYSDPAHFLRHPLASSTPMRRTQTESAASILCNDPTTKDKIREWSLNFLKDNAVQKRLYLNTLEYHGVLEPVGGDWAARAAQYWGQDGWTESQYGSEHDATSTNDTSHPANSCNETCAAQRASSSSSLRNLLELEHGNFEDETAATVAFELISVHSDHYINIPLPPSPLLLPEATESSQADIPSVLVTSHSSDQL